MSRVAFEKHLLVDGANALQAQPVWREIFRRDREEARTRFAAALRPIHDLELMRVTVVFDGRGPELRIERPGVETTFSVLYTPDSLTADDVIERLVAQAGDAGSCMVASGDRGICETVMALGAVTISTGELAAWLERVERRQSAVVQELARAADKKWRRR